MTHDPDPLSVESRYTVLPWGCACGAAGDVTKLHVEYGDIAYSRMQQAPCHRRARLPIASVLARATGTEG